MAEEYLHALNPETPYSSFELEFEEMGLERGWGNTAERVQDTISHLLHLLEARDATPLENFLGRIPLVFNVFIMTPHGYFAQYNVLGYHDTGSQVVYILDQAPAMEHEIIQHFKLQGLDDIIPRILNFETFKLLQVEKGESFFTFTRDMTIRSTKAIMQPTIPKDFDPWRSKLLWASRVLPMPLVALLIIESVCADVGSQASDYPEIKALSRLDFGTAIKVFLAKRPSDKERNTSGNVKI